MKKIIVLLFLVLNIFLFTGILEIYKTNDLAYIHQIDKLWGEATLHKVLDFHDYDKEADSRAVFRMMRELTERYDLLISVHFYHADNPGEYDKIDYYYASSGNIDRRFGLITERSLNFNETDGFYYTSQKDDAGGIFFYLLNKDIEAKIYPVTRLGEIPNSPIWFTSGSREVLEESTALFLAEFGDYVTMVSEPSAEPYLVDSEINAFLPAAVLMAAICLFLLLMTHVQAKAKKISIYKMTGTSAAATAAKMFSPLFAAIALTVILTNLLLFLFFVNAVNARTLPMITDLARSAGYQLLGAFLAAALSCFLLTLIPVYSLLKQSSLTRYLMNANFLLKIAVLLTLLPAASGMADKAAEDITLFFVYKNPAVDRYQYISGYLPEYQSTGYNPMESRYDPDAPELTPVLAEYYRGYRILNEAGALYCNSSEFYGGEWGGSDPEKYLSNITVNENYLQEYPLKDAGGNFVDIDNIDADVVHFVPEHYFQFDYATEEFFGGFDYALDGYEHTMATVVIADEQDLLNFDPRDNEFLERPLMVTLYKDTAFNINATLFHHVFIDSDAAGINELLKDTVFYNKIVIWSMRSEWDSTAALRMKLVLEQARFFVPLLALIVMIMLQYAYLYLKTYAKRIFVEKLMGHSPFRILLRLLLESGAASAVLIINALLRGADPGLLPFVLGLDVLIYLAAALLSRNIAAKYVNAEES